MSHFYNLIIQSAMKVLILFWLICLTLALPILRQQQFHARRLLSITRYSIRINIQSSVLQNPTISTSQTTLTFFSNALTVIQQFLQKRIKVGSQTTINCPIKCLQLSPATLGYPASTASTTTTVSGDLLVYVNYITSASAGYTTSGKSCAYSTLGSASNDMSLRYGRPTVGRLLFNTAPIDGNTLTNRLFATLSSSILRDMIHILGFDSSLYATYLNPTTGSPYSAVTANLTTINQYRASTTVIITPNVLAQARLYYNCTSLIGMQLENEGQDGPVGTYWENQTNSHWQRSIIYDEVMTRDSLGPQNGLSPMTFALLQDMGWYTVDATNNDTAANFGYQKGCDFFNNVCYSSTSYVQFCNTTTYANIYMCSTQYFAKSTCVVNTYSDKCGLWIPSVTCVDADAPNDGYRTSDQEVYGTSSFCATSTLATVSVSAYQQARCYPYVCSTNYTIQFQVSSGSSVQYIQCNPGDAGTRKILNGFVGTLICPNYVDYCLNSRKLCPNWCNQKGYCTGGICNCLSGYSGAGCTINLCTGSTTIYDPAITSCANACSLSTYFVNYYDNTCQPCVNCSQCITQATVCSSCSGSQSLLGTTCYSTCPTGYYSVSNICNACDTSCGGCSVTSTNCTSCTKASTGSLQKYLQSNLCVSTCTSTFYDTINFVCVTACLNNLVYSVNNSSGTYCALCASGTYKQTTTSSTSVTISTDCLSTCPSGFYGNTTNQWCQVCDSNCNSCNGPTATDCTSCYINTYLFQSICVSSTNCPSGTYADASTKYCTVCNSNCGSCATTSTYCLSCNYGYFLNSTTNRCDSSCPTGTFPVKSNQTCLSCDSTCATCSSFNNNSCLTCTGSLNLLTNSSGGFCITSCPTQLYYVSSSVCYNCYSTCTTCTGGSISQCLTCISGMYYLSGVCYYNCPKGYYNNNTTSICTSCHSNCTYCYGSSNSTCYNCTSPLVLYNTTCATSCPGSTQVNTWGVCWELLILSLSALSLIIL